MSKSKYTYPSDQNISKALGYILREYPDGVFMQNQLIQNWKDINLSRQTVFKSVHYLIEIGVITKENGVCRGDVEKMRELYEQARGRTA